MAASSPYSGNDYNASNNFRPYQLPVNDIFKAISAQNEFWEIGARRVKSVYDNALNLNLTLDANKEVKKKFMDEAEKQLTKLSSMDLSSPSVQRQGFNIYKPLFQDEAIMYDNELTKVMGNIYSDAEMFKRKKLSSTGAEGEGYTERNLAYSLDGFEVFNSKTARDPSLLKEMYQKLGKREYTPYYNPTQEYSSILKNCKGSGGEKQDVASNYMYFDSFSKSGANSSETANCFMMGLSEKAKAQMGIDGWAYYKNNPALLAADHRNFALGRQESQVKAIQGKIEGIKAGGISEGERAQLKELEDMLPALQNELRNRTREYDEMVGGNAMNYVTQNFQTLSKGVYLSKNYAALGEAFKSDETNRKLTANAAGIAQFNAIEKSYAQSREHEYNMEEITLRASLARKLKQDAGEIPSDLVNSLNPPVTEDTDTGQRYGEKEFNVERDAAFKTFSDSYQTLSSYMLSKNPTMDRKGFTQEFILNFANEQSKKPIEQQDKQFQELISAYNRAKDNFSALDIRQKSINTIVNNEFGSELDKLNNRPIKIGNVSLTAREMSAIDGGAKIKGVRRVSNPNIFGYDNGGYLIDGESPQVVYQTPNGGLRTPDVVNEYVKLNDKMSQRKNELYRKSYYDARNYITPRINVNKTPAIDQQIRNILGVSGGNNEKNGYKLLGHDRTGKDLLVVALDDDGKEIKPNLERSRSFNVNVTPERVGTSINAVRIPNILPEIANLPSDQQQGDITRLREFQTLMEAQLRNKGSYYSSEELKNNDGTTFPYTNFSFNTPKGTPIKVKAIQANGQTRLVPSVQTKSGAWDTNFQSFATPEELILYFRIY